MLDQKIVEEASAEWLLSEKGSGVFDPEALGALFGASMQKSLDRQAQVLTEAFEMTQSDELRTRGLKVTR